jgi:hypothetical protein
MTQMEENQIKAYQFGIIQNKSRHINLVLSKEEYLNFTIGIKKTFKIKPVTFGMDRGHVNQRPTYQVGPALLHYRSLLLDLRFLSKPHN